MKPVSFRWSEPGEHACTEKHAADFYPERRGYHLEVAQLAAQLCSVEDRERDAQRQCIAESHACAHLREENAQLHLEYGHLQESVSAMHDACKRGSRALKAAAAASGVSLPPTPFTFADARSASHWVEESLTLVARHIMDRRSPSRRRVSSPMARADEPGALNG